MSNLLLIALAKTLLVAGIVFWPGPNRTHPIGTGPIGARLIRTGLIRKLAIAYGVGTMFGLTFFALFYSLVPAIAYHHALTLIFVSVNVTLSYGATAATVALLPLDLSAREPATPLTRERVYYCITIILAAGAFAVTASDFVRAMSIGVVLMSLAEIAALLCNRSGPVSRMLHGEFKQLGVILAVSAGLGVFYECLNLVLPVWVWVTLAGLPSGVGITIMMTVGYIVLIHPLYVVTRLLVAAPAKRC